MLTPHSATGQAPCRDETNSKPVLSGLKRSSPASERARTPCSQAAPVFAHRSSPQARLASVYTFLWGAAPLSHCFCCSLLLPAGSLFPEDKHPPPSSVRALLLPGCSRVVHQALGASCLAFPLLRNPRVPVHTPRGREVLRQSLTRGEEDRCAEKCLQGVWDSVVHSQAACAGAQLRTARWQAVLLQRGFCHHIRIAELLRMKSSVTF